MLETVPLFPLTLELLSNETQGKLYHSTRYLINTKQDSCTNTFNSAVPFSNFYLSNIYRLLL